ncbi:MAG: right-handed parallel beta-helix repeat-containing protein [Ruminococcus sp.]|nr:right-handed parallel beta-helix repeat-containing protein [Ruminococcus sp.]
MKNTNIKRRAASVAAAAMLTISCAAGNFSITSDMMLSNPFVTVAAESTVKFIQAVGYGEGVYATWSSVSGASGYNVYVDGVQIDTTLVRQYPGYMRADAVGLRSGNHTIKVVPVVSGKEDSSKAAQTTAAAYAHDRSGFAFVSGNANGAYNADGTLKSNATVIYVTNATKDSVSVTLPDKKGADTKVTGIQNIITNLKSNTKAGPVCIRFVGNITDPSTLMKGDLLVDTVTCGLTVEGIGNDATLNGFGLVLKNSSNVEVRNLGFMNCNSSEGDNCGLQQGNDHIWVHNCDFFYGDAGSDADQVKGDGALDTKTSTYITHSYNHFWDNGKCNLQGMKSEKAENYITYHHNWFDHSDSRHPRIRTCSVHCYNNYYDGNAKYGVGVTMGASCFVENNYFRNCNYPMLSSMQGSDVGAGGIFSGETGGIIKSYGNIMSGQKAYVTYQQNSTEFDAYEASSKTEKVGSSVKTKSGGTTYNNFDTSSVMYSYTADKASDVPAVVTAKAGRVDGGDFKWTFNNSVDDESYAVNTALKSALTSYKGSVTAIGSGFKEDNTAPPTVTATTAPVIVTDINTTTTAANVTPSVTTTYYTQPSVSSGDQVHNFTASGTSSSFYSISGNLSTAKGTVSYNGLTLTQCLKIETATSISFTAGSSGKFTMVFGEPSATIKIDGTKYTADGSGVLTVDLGAGSHSITKADSANLFYMSFGGSGSSQPVIVTTAPEQPSVQTTTTKTGDVTPSQPVTGANVIYCSPSGKGSGASMSDPAEFTSALKNVPAGGTIYLLDGTYKYSSPIIIEESNSGKSGAMKTVSAYPGAKVTFDFSGEAVSGTNRGFVLDGSYWHFYGFEITKAGDNGMLLSGDNNRIEMMVFNNNQDTGLQISRYQTAYDSIAQWPSYNLILNCTSKNNCDDATMENADGFAAKLTCGEGNVFDGCMAYNNSDDGWDLYAKAETGPTGVVTIKNCIAFRNGFTEDGRGYGGCDGNGFKLGGGGVGTRHVVENCLSFENLNCGFTDNNNPKFGVLKNTTAYNNGIGGGGKANYFVYRCDSSADIQNILTYYNTSKVSATKAAGIKVANDKFKGVVKNSLYYNSKYYYNSGSFNADGSQPKEGTVVTPSDSDFITLSVPAMGTDFHTKWRNPDGTLNTGGFAETNGTYKSLGYHFNNLTPSPIVTTQQPAATTTTTTTTTTTSTTKPAETTTTAPQPGVSTVAGDADGDGLVKMNDAVLIMQCLSNPDKYTLEGQLRDNADVNGNKNGLSPLDALAIQKYLLKLIPSLPEN